MVRSSKLRALAAGWVALAIGGQAVRAQPKIAPKSGAVMCGALTAADFAAVGVGIGPKPTANVDDGGATASCVYTGKSSAAGGVELDIYYPAGGDAREVKATEETAVGEVSGALTPIKIAGADEARWSAHVLSGGPAFATIVVRRSNLVFVLGIPASKDSQSQLLKLTDLVLRRF